MADPLRAHPLERNDRTRSTGADDFMGHRRFPPHRAAADSHHGIKCDCENLRQAHRPSVAFAFYDGHCWCGQASTVGGGEDWVPLKCQSSPTVSCSPEHGALASAWSATHIFTPSRRSLAASYMSLAAVPCLLGLTVVPTIQCGSCRGRTLSAQDNVQGVSRSRLPRFVRSHMTSTEHLRHHQNPCRCCISSRCQITTDCRVRAVCFRAISAALWSRYTSRLVEY